MSWRIMIGQNSANTFRIKWKLDPLLAERDVHSLAVPENVNAASLLRDFGNNGGLTFRFFHLRIVGQLI